MLNKTAMRFAIKQIREAMYQEGESTEMNMLMDGSGELGGVIAEMGEASLANEIDAICFHATFLNRDRDGNLKDVLIEDLIQGLGKWVDKEKAKNPDFFQTQQSDYDWMYGYLCYLHAHHDFTFTNQKPEA